MQSTEIKALLETSFPGAMILAEGQGCDFQLVIVSEVFQSMSTVKRQKTVYSHLNNFIADGSIHAISMQTFTPQEWEQKNGR